MDTKDNIAVFIRGGVIILASFGNMGITITETGVPRFNHPFALSLLFTSIVPAFIISLIYVCWKLLQNGIIDRKEFGYTILLIPTANVLTAISHIIRISFGEWDFVRPVSLSIFLVASLMFLIYIDLASKGAFVFNLGIINFRQMAEKNFVGWVVYEINEDKVVAIW